MNDQPLHHVEWIPRDQLHANDYNPNHVALPELRLLKISILEDGWTQPIVVRENGEIVDGFHRWTVSADKDIAARTNGLVPVVRLKRKDREHQMMSTIRHNRARGKHHVLKMANIVRALRETHQLSEAEIQERLQMEAEEVDRLADRGGMIERGSADAFQKGWVPS